MISYKPLWQWVLVANMLVLVADKLLVDELSWESLVQVFWSSLSLALGSLSLALELSLLALASIYNHMLRYLRQSRVWRRYSVPASEADIHYRKTISSLWNTLQQFHWAQPSSAPKQKLPLQQHCCRKHKGLSLFLLLSAIKINDTINVQLENYLITLNIYWLCKHNFRFISVTIYVQINLTILWLLKLFTHDFW